MQDLNIKEKMAKDVIVLNASELHQENISVGNGKNYLLQGDSYDWLKKIPENSVDAIVCDPPYMIGFMGKEFDKEEGNPAGDKEFWKLVYKTLKPGGYCLAFGGTRKFHRLVVAVEDAGFEIRDMIAWVYGSGFPKSLNIGKAVDKLQGNEREVIGKGKPMSSLGTMHDDNWVSDSEYNETKGTSEWEGWGTALKPALEPITVARKPISEKTVAENCLKWGVGGLNIDGCRVDFISEEDRKESTTKNQHEDFGTKPMTNNNVYGDYSMVKPKNFNPPGRFPANLILSYPENEYILKDNISEEDKEKVCTWLRQNL